MSDIAAEFKQAVLDAIERKEAAIASQRGFELQPSLLDAFANPGAHGVALAALDDFATGYNAGTGTTTVAFTSGISLVGGPDIVTSS